MGLLSMENLKYCDMSTHCWVAQLVSRHRPVNRVPRRRGDVKQQRWNTAPAHSRRDDVTCVYVVARRRAAILSDCKGSGRRDVTVLLNNAISVARRPLTQLGYISEAISRFSSVPGVTVTKSVLRSSSTREFLRGVLRVSLNK
jgi:hypothetical protein